MNAASSSGAQFNAAARNRTRANTHLGVTTLAVLVTAGVTPYLFTALRALAQQTLPPQNVLIVDVASRDNGLGEGTPIAEVVDRSGLDALTQVRIVRAAAARTLVEAVRLGLERYKQLAAAGTHLRTAGRQREDSLSGFTPASGLYRDLSANAPAESSASVGHSQAAAVGETAAQSAPTWLWILHDDCAPQPECLEQLLTAVTNARSVSLAGPKQVDWDRPEQLLEVGLRTTASARRANDIMAGELDQGQYDERSDVLAVGTAGALIEYAQWETLDALPADVGPFADGLMLSLALRLKGKRVIVVPTARLRHRRASYLGLRANEPLAALNASGRKSAAKSEKPLAQANPQRSFRARRQAQLRAWAMLSPRPLPLLLAWIWVLGIGRALFRLFAKQPALARDEFMAALCTLRRASQLRRDRRWRANAAVPQALWVKLYLPSWQIRLFRRERRTQSREYVRRQHALNELQLQQRRLLRRRRRRVLLAVLVVAFALSLTASAHLFRAGALTGGASVSWDSSWRSLWAAAWSTWTASGDGYPTGLNPGLALLAGLSALGALVGVSGAVVVHLLLVLAIPGAVLGAWFAAGTLTRHNALRAWGAIAWGCAPSLLLAVGQGRLTAVLTHVLLPFALTALCRALGWDCRDALGDEETRPESAASEASAYGAGSATAAAVAGALFSVICALTAVTALVIIPALIVLVLALRKTGLRLLLTLIPPVVTVLPVLGQAVYLGQKFADAGAGFWQTALAYLATDYGTPFATALPNGWDLLLGLPVSHAALSGSAVLNIVCMVLLALVPFIGVLGMFATGRRGWSARAAILLAVAALGLAALVVRQVTAVGQTADTGYVLVNGWAGTALSLAWAGFLISALNGAQACRYALVRYHFGWRHFSAAALCVLAFVAPLVLGTGWTVMAYRATAATASSTVSMVLRPATMQVPLIAAQIQQSAAQGRVLALTATTSGVVVQLWRGDGVGVADATPAVLFRQLHTRFSATALQVYGASANASVPTVLADAADQELAASVTRALGGKDEDVAADLAQHGIAVVLLAAQDPAVATTVRSNLNTTVGLEALAHTSAGDSWRVNPGNSDASARLTLLDAQSTAAAAAGQFLSAGTHERTLVLAERASSDWSASVGATQLQPTAVAAGSWRQAFTVPAGVSGQLQVTHRSFVSTLAAGTIWIVWALTLCFSLPLRRRTP